MKTLQLNQIVKYVTSDDQIVDGTIEEVVAPNLAHVRHSENYLALARYSEGKEKNTFHFDEGAAAVAEPAPEPFKPGAKAVPDKPKQQKAHPRHNPK